MIDIAKTLFDVARGLFDLRGELRKATRDRKDRVADYFDSLATLVESVAASLRRGEYPHGSCAQLHTLASLMTTTLEGLIGEDEARDYQERLLGIWQIEQLFGDLQSMSPKQAENRLVEIEQAAGYFRAIAMHLRAA